MASVSKVASQDEEVIIYLKVTVNIPKNTNPSAMLNHLTGLLFRHEPRITRINYGQWRKKVAALVYV